MSFNYWPKTVILIAEWPTMLQIKCEFHENNVNQDLGDAELVQNWSVKPTGHRYFNKMK